MSHLEVALTEMLNNKEIADVVFKFAGGKELYANKCFLQSCSPIWREKFYESGWREKTQKMIEEEIKDVDFEIFQVILEYAYTRKPTLTDANCMRVQEAADRFRIDGLGAAAMLFMTKNISPKNCFDILRKAQGYKDPELEFMALDFLMRDEQVFNTKDILVGVEKENVKKVLSFKRIASNEIWLFRRMVEWGKWKLGELKKPQTTENLKEELKELLELIKLAYMGKDELLEIKDTGLYPTTEIYKHAIELIDRYKGYSFKTSRGIPGVPKNEIKVLHLSANSPTWVRDVKESLLATGLSKYEFINAQKVTPTLEALKGYHVVWLDSGNSFQDPEKLGDVLADYMEQGGSIVVGGVHTLRSESANWALRGKLVMKGYLPLGRGKLVQNKRCTLGEVVDTESFVLRGVKKFDGGKASSHVDSSLTSGARTIAKWSDGMPLIAEKEKLGGGLAVVLNIRPASSKVDAGWWDINSDGRRMIANAVEYAGKRSKIELKGF